MFVYWGMFLITAGLSLRARTVSWFFWPLVGIMFTLVVGLRFEVGGDWHTYIYHLMWVTHLTLPQALEWGDPGYYLINWLVGQAGMDIWLVNLACAAIFSAGLVRFCRTMPDPVLALVVSIPYMVIVLAMGYTRQAAAFGFILWALVYLKDERRIAFVAVVALAITFHKSAVLMIPLAALAGTRGRLWTGLWVGITSYFFYLAFLAEEIDILVENYIFADYAHASTGGPIRVMLNSVPATIFIAFRHRFVMPWQQHKLWFWVSVLSLVCLPLVFIAPTPVDRVALYFMPIQMVVWSHLPFLFSGSSYRLVHSAIIVLYGLIQFVWLNYASHAFAWLPYRLWPF